MRSSFPAYPAPAADAGSVSVIWNRIVRKWPDGQLDSVAWSDLREVSLLKLQVEGCIDGLCWMLAGERSDCLVPLASEGGPALLGWFQQLPGFRNVAVIKALLAEQPQERQVCWEREQGGKGEKTH